MFELACHTWGFSDQPLEQAIQTIARLGFNAVDLGSGTHLDTDAAAKNPKKEAGRIRALLDRFHLNVTDLYLLLPALASPDEGRRLYEVKLFQRLVPFVVALGAPGVTLSPGIAPPESETRRQKARGREAGDEENTAEDDPPSALPPATPPPASEPEPLPKTPFDWAAESLRRVVEIAGETDLRVSIEPHLDSVAPTPDRALALLEAAPGLSITLDWAHFTAQGIVSREIEPLLPHVAHVQIRQAARGRLQTPFPEGGIDIQRMLTLLYQNGYRGALTVEYMTTFGWHGMAAVDIVREIGRTRDALRAYRRALLAG